jgi:ankyrin repeat protein
MSIKKLINNNKWDKVYKILPKIDLYQEITNGNNIAHLAAINNDEKVISYILKKDPNVLQKSNDDGNTPIHLLATYGYIDLLKKCVKENPVFINLLNNNNENIPLILYNDIDFIKFVLNHTKDNIIINDGSGQNIISKNIDENNKNILELLLKNCADHIKKHTDSLLCYALKENKLDGAKILIENGYDVNKKDSNFFTPLLYAVYNKQYDIIDQLIKKGADVNYNGAEGDHNPMIWAINNQENKIINLLLDAGFNVNNPNRNYETPLHIALSNKNTSPTIISKLLYHGDLNAVANDGQTPLHLVCKYHNWKNYNEILKHKKVNIFVYDKYNKRPIDYLNANCVYDFIDVVLDSYTKQLNLSKFKESNYPEKCVHDSKSLECKNEIKKYMFDTKRSIPKNKDYVRLNKKIKFISGNKSIYGLFNSDTLHNVIYTILLMKKYKNVGIPFQFYIKDAFINDKIIQMNNNLYKFPYEFVISDLVRIYSENFYEILPYLIIWRSSAEHYVHKNLGFLVKKCLMSPKIRFILFKLTLVVEGSNTHANIILYDKQNTTLERFEPYGSIPYLESDKLDKFIEETGKQYINENLTYLSPKDLFGTLGFQTISGDNRQELRSLGMAIGYCLPWTFWYLEMRVSNPDISPKILLENAKNMIIKDSNGVTSDKLFISFIKDYAAQLDRMKNDFMKSIGVSVYNIYNLVPSKNDQNKIINTLLTDFKGVVNERY